jgi:hypothetical protein
LSEKAARIAITEIMLVTASIKPGNGRYEEGMKRTYSVKAMTMIPIIIEA